MSQAQVAVQSEPRITQGTLRTSTGKVLPLEHTEVSARVDGPVATVQVRQRFLNDTGGPIEATYLFPLPHEASVHRMSFQIGSRVVNAVIKEKEEARRAYQAALAEGRSATLLEQERPNLFALSVANVPAGEKVEVTLGYQELVGYDDGEWRFVFPMVAPDRFHSGAPVGASAKDKGAPTDQVRDGAKIRPPRPASNDRAGDVSLTVEVRSARAVTAPPSSPSHQVVVESTGALEWKIQLHPSDSLPNRDFVLAWRGETRGVRPLAFFERKPDKVGTFLLVVTPPVAEPPTLAEAEKQKTGVAGKAIRCGNCYATLDDPGAVKDVPGLGPSWKCTHCGALVAVTRDEKKRSLGLPRDVIFLVDRSCSMRGGSVAQARRAVRAILEGLGSDDAVQLFAFDHDRLAADGEGQELMPVGKKTFEAIDGFLEAKPARGGTELEEALERAAKIPEREGRTRLYVLLTDAAVGNEGRLLRRAPEILGKSARLFVLGIGPAVNRYLVDRLARVCGGASDVLLPHEDVDAVVPRFARRVRQGGPVLRKIALTWEDALPADVYPRPVPELFGGQPVKLLGRYSGTGPSKLILTGETATGEVFRQEVDVSLPETSEQVPGLERLWARLRIDSRLDRLTQEPGEASEIRLEVLGLALKHSLVSPYTALVAEDSEKRVTEPAQKVEIQNAAAADRGGAPKDALAAPASIPSPSAGPMGAAAPGLPMPPPCCAPAPAKAARMVEREMDEDEGACLDAAPSPEAAEEEPRMERRARSMAMPSPARMSKASAGAGLLGAVAGAVRGLMSKEDAKREVGGDRSTSRPSPSMRPPSPMPARGSGARGHGSAPLRAEGSDEYTRQMLEELKGKACGELDLVFLVDETGSMGAYIAQVKQRLLEIIDAVKAAPLCKSLRLGLVSYRDHAPQDSTFASRVVPLTEDLDSVRKGVQRMEASGGGDGPESVTDGLYDLVRLDWRAKAARVVVWVGDAPPHGVEPAGDAFPQGCPCGHHWYAQAECCREMGISIYAVGCLPGLRGFVGAEDVFKTVAQATRGLYLPLSEAPLLVPLIVGAAESELDKQRIEEMVARVLEEHRAVLEPADEQERVRYVTEVLQQQGVQARRMEWKDDGAPPPLRFRDLAMADVEESLDWLRREGRSPL
ncbi:MAG TPA: VIT domain-containing protein [Myxococcales bacterium]|jgi:Ca-activated chloride channel family protein